jgi:RND superfamily putative drug exporter
MFRLLYRIGHVAGVHPWRVLAGWILVAVSVLILSSSLGGEPDESFRLPGADSQHAADLLTDRFPEQTLYTSNVVSTGPTG